MISLLITLIVLAVLLYILRLLLPMLGLPEPLNTVIFLVFGLIVLLWLLSQLGIFSFRGL